MFNARLAGNKGLKQALENGLMPAAIRSGEGIVRNLDARGLLKHVTVPLPAKEVCPDAVRVLGCVNRWRDGGETDDIRLQFDKTLPTLILR